MPPLNNITLKEKRGKLSYYNILGCGNRMP